MSTIPSSGRMELRRLGVRLHRVRSGALSCQECTTKIEDDKVAHLASLPDTAPGSGLGHLRHNDANVDVLQGLLRHSARRAHQEILDRLG